METKAEIKKNPGFLSYKKAGRLIKCLFISASLLAVTRHALWRRAKKQQKGGSTLGCRALAVGLPSGEGLWTAGEARSS